ncbi:alpha/beta fold hydrolase [Natronocalculus amylovorans]|uniref:Alpha/beta hydrolase n=1 Tax=Natronocalculus amylovorans TaxID=2917812 RepID=A0AAE3FU17_9EURY|nr:alpha/beta hydrolase [Natronocalculus amylovorans]MCL9815348.1 alpha/beta hydrolase [Natronocalculus amylovorans]
MDLRRGLGYATLGLGAIAAVNTTLRRRTPSLEPALEGHQQLYRWRGMNVAYTEAGDPSNPDLVCLHGINAAGSSGEFREIFDELAEEYHVIAPDLPGFGRSDRPPLRYSAALYEDFIIDFLSEFNEPAVIASSLTGAYAAAAANETPIASLVLICPTTVAGPEPPKGALLELFRLPLVGEALFNLVVSKPSIRYFNADHGYYDMDKVSDEWQEYEWTTAHQPNARFAPASFISGYLNTDINLDVVLRSLELPVTIVWGREADITPLSNGRALAESADATLIVLDDSMLLPHVEFPSEFLEGVSDRIVAIKN